jgi:hypothetical protein
MFMVVVFMLSLALVRLRLLLVLRVLGPAAYDNSTARNSIEGFRIWSEVSGKDLKTPVVKGQI